MKLLKFKNLGEYRFSLVFEADRFPNLDLKSLIGEKVGLGDLGTARIDEDWGCLEFKDGDIDIEPETLYSFCQQQLRKGDDAPLMKVAEEQPRYETRNNPKP